MNPNDFAPTSITLDVGGVDQFNIDQLEKLLNARPGEDREIRMGSQIRHVLRELIEKYNTYVEAQLPEQPQELGTVIVAKRSHQNADTLILTMGNNGDMGWIDTFHRRPLTWKYVVTNYDDINIVYAPTGAMGHIDNTPSHPADVQ